MRHTLTKNQVLSRLRAGQSMYTFGWTSNGGIFDDGAIASHNLILHLLEEGKIDRPTGTSVNSPYLFKEVR